MNIGKLEVVQIREAFRHEAHNFTVWLETNIDALAQRLNMQLTVVAREKAVGSFNVDLLCEDSDGDPVIVENQLERSDHDHLGKLLTYLVNLEAKTAIWITTEPRPEHQRVVDWLNESTGTDFAFYLVRIEAVRIGDSPFAPLFTVLVAPDEQTREIGETKKELADRHHLRLEFWTTLLERSRTRTHLFSNKTPSHDHWLGTGSGRSGIEFNYLILKDGAGIDLVIDVGDYDKNKAVFDRLYAHKDEIEAEFGDVLSGADWITSVPVVL
ncbi:MAG: DUF4268 domain-containing protein [Chloroflexi bacterium]|uniref:DUF4268 domain-containing protein n=1 Tax=Candidatus Flexifilum breve TaxID=3140694 RepID=UPI003135CB05|nr:DUF4268 domain-containing protein [Chloroflexota bacterium]